MMCVLKRLTVLSPASYNNLKTTDTYLSLDVFGVTLWQVDDNNIGQQYNDMIKLIGLYLPNGLSVPLCAWYYEFPRPW